MTYEHLKTEIGLHRAIRNLYLDHPDSMKHELEEFDARDWEYIHPDHVPDVRPLFGGEMYHCLGHIYDHVDITQEILQEILQPASPTKRLSKRHRIDERYGWIWSYRAFMNCQTRCISEISRPWEIIIRDVQGAAGSEEVELPSEAWTSMPRWTAVYRRLLRKHSRPEKATLLAALVTLFPQAERTLLQSFVTNFLMVCACQRHYIQCIDRFISEDHQGVHGLARALHSLLEIQFIMLVMGMSLATIGPMLPPMEEWALA